MAASETDEDGQQWRPPSGRWTREDGVRMAESLERSGLSVAKFARERGVTAQRVYWWLERLGRRGRTSRTAERKGSFVPVRISGTASEHRSSACSSSLDVVIGETTVIRVGRGFDAELLLQVVAALREESC
jgi:transposase-like protein